MEAATRKGEGALACYVDEPHLAVMDGAARPLFSRTVSPFAALRLYKLVPPNCFLRMCSSMAGIGLGDFIVQGQSWPFNPMDWI